MLEELSSGRPRLRSLIFILGAFVFLTASSWWLSTTALNRWQSDHLGWNYSYHILFLLLPFFAVMLDRSRAALYGISLERWRSELRVGLPLAALLVGAPLLADGVFAELTPIESVARRGMANTLLFQLVFVGYAEELLFRGFFQGEFNRTFGRPFSWKGTPFGAGLFLASFLFGVGHLLNPFNPLGGAHSLDWGAFAGTFVLACVLGMVRERMGGLLTVALLHFSLIFFPISFRVGPASGSAMLLTWLVAATVLARTAPTPGPTANPGSPVPLAHTPWVD